MVFKEEIFTGISWGFLLVWYGDWCITHWDFTFGLVWRLVLYSLGIYFWFGLAIGASLTGTLLWYGVGMVMSLLSHFLSNL